MFPSVVLCQWPFDTFRTVVPGPQKLPPLTFTASLEAEPRGDPDLFLKSGLRARADVEIP